MSAVLDATRMHTELATPLGTVTLVRHGERLAGLYFEHHWYRPAESTFGQRTDDGFEEISTQLAEYFIGHRRTFQVPMLLMGSPAQVAVWRHLQHIPYGQTTTYGAIGREVGLRLSAQQIGKLVGQNPLCILIPCHRVVAANGNLLGYAGGRRRQRALLDLELSVAGQQSLFPAPSLSEEDRRDRVQGPFTAPPL